MDFSASACPYLLMAMLLALLLSCAFAASQDIQKVIILTPGPLLNETFTSLWYNAPVYQLAVEEMNRKYEGRFKINIHFLYELNATTYVDLAEDVLSHFYYRELDKESANAVTVVINPGIANNNEVSGIGLALDLLHLNT